MNRRNVLIGLGTVAVGGGAAFGSGAFSQVEADRTVSVETTGDATAFLGITGDGTYITDDSSGGVLTIDLGQVSGTSGDGFNNDAVTVVNGVFTLTNNAADDEDIDVGFGSAGSQTAKTTLAMQDSSGTEADVTFYFGSDPSSSSIQTVSSGNSVDVNVEVDTLNTSGGGDGQSAAITVVALDSDGA